MGWKGESRRHSLSRKGIKTNIDKTKRLSVRNFVARGVSVPVIVAIKQHLKGLNEYQYQSFMGSKLLGLKNKLSDEYWKKEGKYPNRDKQKEIWDHVNSLDLDELIQMGVIQSFIVKKGMKYHLIFGSDIHNLSGTHSKTLGEGNIVVFDSIAPDGTTWFIHEGERGKHSEINSFSGLERDDRIEKVS